MNLNLSVIKLGQTGKMLNGFASDGRVGDSHLNVPGHDGKYGYGGTCFPKELDFYQICII